MRNKYTQPKITNHKPISPVYTRPLDLTKVEDRVTAATSMTIPGQRNTFYKLFMSDPNFLEAKKLYPLVKLGILSTDVIKKYENYFRILESEGLV